MYESLNKNEHWAWGSGAEGAKKGWKVIKCDWMPLVRLRYQGVSYWVVPWGAIQASAGVEAGPDDGRGLGGVFGTTRLSVTICDKAVTWVYGGLRQWK